jgi:hypothetical protein
MTLHFMSSLVSPCVLRERARRRCPAHGLTRPSTLSLACMLVKFPLFYVPVFATLPLLPASNHRSSIHPSRAPLNLDVS